MLLPAVLRAAGYQTLAVSSHPWVAPQSAFGEPFEGFDLLPAAPSRGHAGAAEVVDRGLALWAGRDAARPTFLYLHFMDAHMPRFLPEAEPRFPVPGYDWRARFRPDGEPDFDRARRSWTQFDASDFTPDDRRYFAAVYDTLVAYLDEHLGRLFTTLRRDDPTLSRTVILVVADHGEELGDDGRIDHGDSLADAVQHVPWIMAGGGIAGPGGCADHQVVDAMPTLPYTFTFPAAGHARGRRHSSARTALCPGAKPQRSTPGRTAFVVAPPETPGNLPTGGARREGLPGLALDRGSRRALRGADTIPRRQRVHVAAQPRAPVLATIRTGIARCGCALSTGLALRWCSPNSTSQHPPSDAGMAGGDHASRAPRPRRGALHDPSTC